MQVHVDKSKDCLQLQVKYGTYIEYSLCQDSVSDFGLQFA